MFTHPTHKDGLSNMVAPFSLPLSLTTPIPPPLNPGLDSCGVYCLDPNACPQPWSPPGLTCRQSPEIDSCCPWLSVLFSRPPGQVCPASWLCRRAGCCPQVGLQVSHCRRAIHGALWLKAGHWPLPLDPTPCHTDHLSGAILTAHHDRNLPWSSCMGAVALDGKRTQASWRMGK